MSVTLVAAVLAAVGAVAALEVRARRRWPITDPLPPTTTDRGGHVTRTRDDR